jgi:hypothetical protein
MKSFKATEFLKRTRHFTEIFQGYKARKVENPKGHF